MHETEDDVARLQELLDRSYVAAGPHLRSVTTPRHRVDAADLVRRLQGMALLTVATVTADGRPVAGPVDGIFHRGAFHFGSSAAAVRTRHLRRRPAVSATHLPGEDFAVTVHGHAAELDLADPAHAAFRRTLLEVYVPRYGPEWENFLDSGPVYFRIEAERLFTFQMTPG